jgi:type IV secretion system protein VirD4
MARSAAPYGSAKLFRHVNGPGNYLFDLWEWSGGAYGVLLGHNFDRPSRLACTLVGRRAAEFLQVRRPRSTTGYPWWTKAARGHALSFCTTGGGKNARLLTGALLTYGGNCLVLDPKGESYWITSHQRRRFGQKVYKLDPYNRANENYGAKVGVNEPSQKFNPLSSLDPRSEEFAEDVDLIADAVIFTPPNTDPHWPDSARCLVSGLIAAAVEQCPGFGAFRDVRNALTSSDAALKKQIEEIVKRNPDSLAGRKLGRFVEHADSKEIASIRSTAATQTAMFDAVKLLDAMETGPEAVDLAELVTGKVTIYVILPPGKLATHGRWMRLVVQLALRAIGNATTPPPVPVLLLLDELGTINPGAGLRSIEEAYGLLGGMGVRVWGVFQNLGQLQRDYPGSWETMIANCQFVTVQAVNDLTTARHFSDFMGQKTIEVESRSSSKGEVSRSWSLTGVPLMRPEDIMKIPSDEILILPNGAHPTIQRTLPYYLDPLYVGRFRPDPNYPAPPAIKPYDWEKEAPPMPLDTLALNIAARVVAWARGDGKQALEWAAAWARTDGAAHARAAAAQASEAVSRASAWVGAKWRQYRKS